MSRRFPLTPAITALQEAGVEYREHLYDYRRSGTRDAAEALGVDEHAMIKTIVMEDDNRRPFIILMHGDKEISTKKLARELEVKSAAPCSPRDAQRYTGYMVGGISPFGTRRELPIYVEETVLRLPTIFINAGRRGVLVEMKPRELSRVLKPKPVNVAR